MNINTCLYIHIYSCLNNVCIYHININVNTVYIYIRICVVSLTSDFGSLLREALRAILSGNQPFNLDQKIHVFWTTFSRCKCFQGKQDNEAYPNSEKSGNFLTLANPKGFFQWSNPPNSEKSSENSKIPKKKNGLLWKMGVPCIILGVEERHQSSARHQPRESQEV